MLARAASAAPSVHHAQPWTIAFDADVIELFEDSAIELPGHDPGGRDRIVSCGTALTNLVLTVRALGRDAEVSLLPDTANPKLLARIEPGASTGPSPVDAHRYTAVYQRRSYQAPFSLYRPDSRILAELYAAADEDTGLACVPSRPLDQAEDCAVLADLLGYASTAFRDNRTYQREPTAWSNEFPADLPDESTLPWTGLVRGDMHLPDAVTLAQRLRTEVLLLVHTETDDRLAHLLAGAATQRVWLTAVANGLAGSVLTQPLQLNEVRSGLAK